MSDEQIRPPKIADWRQIKASYERQIDALTAQHEAAQREIERLRANAIEADEATAKLFLLAQTPDDAAGPERGPRWEARIATELGLQGYPVEPLPGGIRVFGTVPASGLRSLRASREPVAA